MNKRIYKYVAVWLYIGITKALIYKIERKKT